MDTGQDKTLPPELPVSGMMQAWLLPYHQSAVAPHSITLMEYFREIKRRWKVLLLSIVLFVAAAAAVALLATPIWQANILMTIRPQSSTEGLGRSLLSQLGGLASIAGLAGGGGTSDTEAFAVLQSRETVEKFITANNLLPILFYKDWDAARNAWQPLANGPPTLADGYRYFTKNVLKIGQDRKSGMVSLTIDWRDRQVAADWANAYIKFADDSLRNRTMDESRVTIEYLDAQLKAEESVPVRESLFQMLEGQQKSLVFAKTRREFAFRIIDPAVVPDKRERIWPKRRLLVAGGAAAGLAAGLAYVFILVYARNSRRAEN